MWKRRTELQQADGVSAIDRVSSEHRTAGHSYAHVIHATEKLIEVERKYISANIENNNMRMRRMIASDIGMNRALGGSNYFVRIHTSIVRQMIIYFFLIFLFSISHSMRSGSRNIM